MVTTVANPRVPIGQLVVLLVPVHTTAAAQDVDVGALFCQDHPFMVTKAIAMFHVIDTFASGVDIDLERDDGSTETAFANYDTASGTAVGTEYEFTFTAYPMVMTGERLQVRVNDDEDAAIQGVIQIEGYWMPG